MAIFKKFFGRHFYKQIPHEAEKNIYRTVSILTGLINKEIENLAQQTIGYINQYIDTISKALSIQTRRTRDLEEDLETLAGLGIDGR